MKFRAFIVAVLIVLATAARAVQPDEILNDPVLEQRARNISAGLRCLVCQNQSIDESEASIAKDLRVLIREQLTQGKLDGDVVNYVVARYGDYVLLKPRFTPANYVLWFAPFVIALSGIVLVLCRIGTAREEPTQLTEAEKTELEQLLRK